MGTLKMPETYINRADMSIFLTAKTLYPVLGAKT
jgi:hypothetical protein